MNPWDTYKNRNTLRGSTGRERAKYALMNRLTHQIPSTLSYQNVDIDGVELCCGACCVVVCRGDR